MANWPTHPALLALALLVLAGVYLITRSWPLAALCGGAVLVGGMIYLQHQRLKAPKASEPNKCYHCDYDLSGLPLHEHRCPECGNRRRYH